MMAIAHVCAAADGSNRMTCITTPEVVKLEFARSPSKVRASLSDAKRVAAMEFTLTRPAISAPTITLDSETDGAAPATDGTASAAKFTGRRTHHVIPRAGHNVPQEEPEAFAGAVMELIGA